MSKNEEINKLADKYYSEDSQLWCMLFDLLIQIRDEINNLETWFLITRK